MISVLVGALLRACGKSAKTVEMMVTLRETICALNATARGRFGRAREPERPERDQRHAGADRGRQGHKAPE